MNRVFARFDRFPVHVVYRQLLIENLLGHRLRVGFPVEHVGVRGKVSLELIADVLIEERIRKERILLHQRADVGFIIPECQEFTGGDVGLFGDLCGCVFRPVAFDDRDSCRIHLRRCRVGEHFEDLVRRPVLIQRIGAGFDVGEIFIPDMKIHIVRIADQPCLFEIVGDRPRSASRLDDKRDFFAFFLHRLQGILIAGINDKTAEKKRGDQNDDEQPSELQLSLFSGSCFRFCTCTCFSLSHRFPR